MKTRPMRKLLELLLEQTEKECRDGLCLNTAKLLACHIINAKECNNLLKYIDRNRPTEGVYFDPEMNKLVHYWEPGEKEPRIAWLKYRLSLKRA